jgi:ribosomal protein S18 acetylase RimI-like enzyme
MKNFRIKFIAFLLLYTFAVKCEVLVMAIELYEASRDKEAVQKIVNESPAIQCEALGSPPGTTQKYIESSKYITKVLRVNNKTMGFVNYLVKDLSFLTFYITRVGFINLIGIDKDYRGKGYGKILMQETISHLKQLNVPSIFLFTKEDNENAVGLYKNVGFKAITTFPMEKSMITKELTIASIYRLKLDIPVDHLPKGNIIQQHPHLSLTLASLGIGGLFYTKFFNKH